MLLLLLLLANKQMLSALIALAPCSSRATGKSKQRWTHVFWQLDVVMFVVRSVVRPTHDVRKVRPNEATIN